MSLFRRTSTQTDVDAAEAHGLATAGKAVLVDVREPGEWRAGHAPAARHLPLNALPARADELPRDTIVVAVCRSGNRSGVAARHLRSAGLDARNLRGGMVAWAAAGLPVVRDGGRPGTVA